MTDSGEKYLDVYNAPRALAWLRAFKARMRVSGYKDDEESQVYSITDSFLACAGTAAVEKVTHLLALKEPDACKFAELETVIKKYLKPETRLVMAERARFFNITQGDHSIAEFIVALRAGAQHCKFNELKAHDDPHEEMIKMRLVSGLAPADQQLHKK